LAGQADVVVPDLRGFGESDKHRETRRGPGDLRHFWSHWSGPGYEPTGDDLDHLVSVYGPPGAFTASIAWYRAGAGSVAASLAERVPDPGDRLAVPATVLWPSRDPLFPIAWSDRIGDFFSRG
jgi:pimeloyl-ACP methyl ester carboxylesterase